jgi:hypothetical protein
VCAEFDSFQHQDTEFEKYFIAMPIKEIKACGAGITA